MSVRPEAVRFDEDVIWVKLSDGPTMGVPLAGFSHPLRAVPSIGRLACSAVAACTGKCLTRTPRMPADRRGRGPDRTGCEGNKTVRRRLGSTPCCCAERSGAVCRVNDCPYLHFAVGKGRKAVVRCGCEIRVQVRKVLEVSATGRFYPLI